MAEGGSRPQVKINHTLMPYTRHEHTGFIDDFDDFKTIVRHGREVYGHLKTSRDVIWLHSYQARVILNIQRAYSPVANGHGDQLVMMQNETESESVSESE